MNILTGMILQVLVGSNKLLGEQYIYIYHIYIDITETVLWRPVFFFDSWDRYLMNARFFSILLWGTLIPPGPKTTTLPETKIAPENRQLE